MMVPYEGAEGMAGMASDLFTISLLCATVTRVFPGASDESGCETHMLYSGYQGRSNGKTGSRRLGRIA